MLTEFINCFLLEGVETIVLLMFNLTVFKLFENTECNLFNLFFEKLNP